jgi:hypothetical protein
MATLIFGVVLIAAILVAPNGIQGGAHRLWTRLAKPRTSERGAVWPVADSADN